MLHASRRVLSRAPLSSSVAVLPTDTAFQYPRFSLKTHVSDLLPELKQAKALYTSPPSPATTERDKQIRVNLKRAEEIFRNLCPDGNVGGPNTPEYVVKDWVGVAAAHAWFEPLARTPQADKERIAMLAPLVRLARTADLKDTALFDSFCVVVAAYADSALRLSTYGDDGIGSLSSFTGKAENLERFRSPSDTVVTFATLCDVVDRLIEASFSVATENRESRIDRATIQTAYSKLCALRSILEIPCTGALMTCLEIIDRPARLRGSDPELISLMVTMRAEIRVRLENGVWGLESIDELVKHEFVQAQERLHFHFAGSKPDGGIKMDGLETMRDVYTSIAMAKAAYFLGVPKDPKGDAPGVFTHHATRQLSLSPILLCPSGAQQVVDTSSRVKFPSRGAKNMALKEVERALKMNRELYPHDKDNLKAGYLLRLTACCYAELKDYLYANGLFNSAIRVFDKHYGVNSLESAEVLRWHEAYHRYVGSTQEADAQLNRINAMRAEHKLGPVTTLAAAGTQNKGTAGGVQPRAAAM
jgi:hypothetical protein